MKDLHKEVGNPSQGGRESFTRRSGILHKEVGNPSQGGRESFTRRLGILHKEVGNPSQQGRNQGGEGAQGAHAPPNQSIRSAFYHHVFSCLFVLQNKYTTNWDFQQGDT